MTVFFFLRTAPAFSPFPTMYSKAFFLGGGGSLKVGIVWYRVKTSFKVKATFYLSSANTFISDQSKILLCVNPLPDDKILECSKLKEIADDILKCIENEK